MNHISITIDFHPAKRAICAAIAEVLEDALELPFAFANLEAYVDDAGDVVTMDNPQLVLSSGPHIALLVDTFNLLSFGRTDFHIGSGR
jgi:hypothetical protein